MRRRKQLEEKRNFPKKKKDPGGIVIRPSFTANDAAILPLIGRASLMRSSFTDGKENTDA